MDVTRAAHPSGGKATAPEPIQSFERTSLTSFAEQPRRLLIEEDEEQDEDQSQSEQSQEQSQESTASRRKFARFAKFVPRGRTDDGARPQMSAPKPVVGQHQGSSSSSSTTSAMLRRSVSMSSIHPSQFVASTANLASSGSALSLSRSSSGLAASDGRELGEPEVGLKRRFSELRSASTSLFQQSVPPTKSREGENNGLLPEPSTTTASSRPGLASASVSLSRQAPLDWSLKTRLRLRSPVQFEWCPPTASGEVGPSVPAVGFSDKSHSQSSASGSSQETMFAAHVGVLATGKVVDGSFRTESSADPTPAIDVEASMMAWHHPSEVLPLTIINACRLDSAKASPKKTPSERAMSNFLRQRRRRWADALTAAVESVLMHDAETGRGSPFAYLVPPLSNLERSSMVSTRGTRLSATDAISTPTLAMTVVLFVAARIGGSSRPIAVIAQSTQGLRDRLKRARAHFREPFVSSRRASDSINDEEEIGQDMEALRRQGVKVREAHTTSSFARNDHKLGVDSNGIAGALADASSTLVFEGTGQIRSLVRELLAPDLIESDRLPSIISPRPFVYASLERSNITSKIVQEADGRDVKRIHEIIISGILLPTMVGQLIRVLQQHRAVSDSEANSVAPAWEARFETLGASASLNIAPDAIGPVSPRKAPFARLSFLELTAGTIDLRLGAPTPIPGQLVRAIRGGADLGDRIDTELVNYSRAKR